MNLALQLLRSLDDPTLDHAGRAALRCALARELTEAGSYEAARSALGELWQRVGEAPRLDGLDRAMAAEVLLRAGTLSGWIGSARQVGGAQEEAKNLISRGLEIFQSLGAQDKVAEAEIELAWCYFREGAIDEARIMLRDARDRLGEDNIVLRASAMQRLAEIERVATRPNDALDILNEMRALVEATENHALKGRFYNTLAHTLDDLSIAENRQDYTDRALIESAAASYHFEQAGHTPHYARVENNLGFLLYRLGRYTDAHEHLDRARSLFVSLKDFGSVGQVDDTRARVLLAQGRNADAERVVRGAVNSLRKGGEQALLAEALTTYGVALARLGRVEQARAVLREAVEVAESAGDREGAGRAALTLIEERGLRLRRNELVELYQRADTLLAGSQHVGTLARLRACARRLLSPDTASNYIETDAPLFLYGSEQTADLVHYAECVAKTLRPVLVTGETGTGKEVLARLIHHDSQRTGAFVAVNCAAICDTLFESQLFGHKKGSFTDALEDYGGAVCEAKGGTLFLDEVGELSEANQAKLLRLIDGGEVYAVGSPVPEQVDVRIVAATNRDLKREVEAGRFRADLFYRLSAFLIEIPPLRERPEDISVLARHFIEEASRRHAKRLTFTPESIEALRSLRLKGNVRELRSLIERSFLLAADGTEVTQEQVETLALRQTQKAGLTDAWASCSLDEEVRLFEGKLIRRALDAAHGQLTAAARLLGITHQGLSFILNGRQKELLKVRQPVRRRRGSIIRADRTHARTRAIRKSVADSER
ncbi:MAG TPA: sigma 54-interacting transcriptional regulator [Pyrinomonadaceae bacterium]|nr:sigma 54-interacting transcriptional regulator [Pyrinomonadaceae bacterium]